jgi:predicted peptidase
MPKDNDPEAVILYLHGLGEVGMDLNVLYRNDIPKQIKTGLEKPAVIIAPQVNSGTSWPKNTLLKAFTVLDTYNLDRHVTGLSLGGRGTYAAIINSYAHNGNQPGYFKTAAPIAGNTATLDYTKYIGTAVKIYHGNRDTTIGINSDRKLYAYLKQHGIDVQMKEYNAGHSVWPMAYQNDEYWAWWDSKR